MLVHQSRARRAEAGSTDREMDQDGSRDECKVYDLKDGYIVLEPTNYESVSSILITGKLHREENDC